MASSYHFIIISSSWDLYSYVFKDIVNLPNVTYISRPFNNICLTKLFYFFLHPKLNSVVKIPFKQYLNKFIINKVKHTDKPLCFIIYYGWVIINNGLIEDIKRRYPTAKIVIYFTDLIKIQKMRFSGNPVNMCYLKEISDLILTYDISEAKEFDIIHYDVPLSIEKENGISAPEYDVYFIGQAKDRLPIIMDVYKRLTADGLKVNFILSNVRKEQQKQYKGISYISGLKLSYADNIRNVKNSKCILEIIQGNSSGQTFRTKEAIAYGKKLLTNNSNIIEAPFYNPEYISYFSAACDIDKSFIESLSKNELVDYGYKHKLSPIKLLEFIESKIE